MRAFCFFLTQQSIFVHRLACRCIKAPDSRLSVGKAVRTECDTTFLRRACQRSDGQTVSRLCFRFAANGDRLFTERLRLRTNRRGMFFRHCISAYRYRFIAFRLSQKSERRRSCAFRLSQGTESNRAGSAGNGIRSRRCGSCSARIGRHAEGARLYTVRVRVRSYRRTILSLRACIRSDGDTAKSFRSVIKPISSHRIGTVIGIDRDIMRSPAIRIHRSRRIFRIGKSACGQQRQNHYGRHRFFTVT